MERRDFQRILTLVDTIHDYKASTRGNLMDAKIFQESLHDELKKLNIDIPKKGTKEKSKNKMIQENIENYPNEITINLQKIKDDLDDDIEVPYYIEDFITENLIIDKIKLLNLINLLKTPPKNMPYNPNRLLETLMLIFIHEGFKKSLGLSRQKHYIDIKTNCANTSKIYSNAADFCEKIYVDTYPVNNLFKSVTKLEEKILNVSVNYARTYDVHYPIIEWSDDILDKLSQKKYVKVCLGKKKNSTGIYANMDNATDKFVKLVKRFFKANNVIFAYDSNGIENDWMKDNRYRGLFLSYDSLNQDGKKSQKGGMPISIDNEDYAQEFQSYKLTKAKEELILFDSINVEKNDKGKFIVNLYYKQRCEIIDLDERSKGLPLFLKLFDEITKRTLGYKNISTSTYIKDQLEKGLKKLCLDDFKKMYKITLKEIDPDSEKYFVLTKEEFVKALFDIKRSMDYLYVKACLSANMKKQDKDTKFVFVSLDKSAIAYSIMCNNPCILTTTQGGNKYIELFNPDENYEYYMDELKNAINTNSSSQVSQNTYFNNTKSQQSQAQTSKTPQVRQVFNHSIETMKSDETFKESLELLNNLKFTSPKYITLGQGKMIFDLDDCQNWKFQGKQKHYERIMKKICKDYKENTTTTGGNANVSSNTTKTEIEPNHLMEQQIPLNEIDTFAEFASPFYMFLQFYSQISPTIDFFWFMVFKTYFFISYGNDMDKTTCASFDFWKTINSRNISNNTIRNAYTRETNTKNKRSNIINNSNTNNTKPQRNN